MIKMLPPYLYKHNLSFYMLNEILRLTLCKHPESCHIITSFHQESCELDRWVEVYFYIAVMTQPWQPQAMHAVEIANASNVQTRAWNKTWNQYFLRVQHVSFIISISNLVIKTYVGIILGACSSVKHTIPCGLSPAALHQRATIGDLWRSMNVCTSF